MNYLSLFSGAGGGDLGALLLNWKCVGYVEKNEYCQKIINQRINDGIFDPGYIFGDIRELTKEMIDMAVNYWHISKKTLEDNMAAHRKNYDEAVKLYDKGFSIQEVANYYNITRQAMHKILKRRNMTFRSNLKHGEDNHFFRGGVKASNRCQNILEQAINKGIIQRKIRCETCNVTDTFKDGRTAIQAHHSDYNKPLDVIWFCQKHHHEWHKYNKPIEFMEDKSEAGIDVITAGFP